MPVSEICNREVIVVQRETTVNEAAKLMRQHHVGSVVVFEERKGVRVPVGIVTDRDLVVEVMAPELVQMAHAMRHAIEAGRLARRPKLTVAAPVTGAPHHGR